MKTPLKIALWVTGTLVLLLIVAVVSLPLFLDRQQVKERIRSQLTDRLGGDVEFNTVQASFFPLEAKISGLRLGLAQVNGTIDSVVAGFQYVPLLTGTIRIDDITVENPDLTVLLPDPQAGRKEKPGTQEPPFPEQIRRDLSELLARIESALPNASIHIQNGTVAVKKKGTAPFLFNNIEAAITLPPETLEIEVAAGANLWKSMTFNGRMDADGSNAAGQVQVTELDPEPLMHVMLPEMAAELDSAKLSLQIDFRSEDMQGVQASLQGRAVYEKIPYPVDVSIGRVVYGGETLQFKDFLIQSGASRLQAGSANLSLTGEHRFVIQSASADLSMNQTAPWAASLLAQVEEYKALADEYKDAKGTLTFSSLDLRGPLRQPDQWTFAYSGQVEDLWVAPKELPTPLELEQGKFQGTRQQFNLELRDLAAMDATVSLSGAIEDPMTDARRVDVSMRGRIGSDAVRWMTNRFALSDQLSISQGMVRINELDIQGPLSRPEKLNVTGSGTLVDTVIETPYFPAPISIAKGGVRIQPDAISLAEVQLHSLNTSMAVSGSLMGVRDRPISFDLKFTGALGPGTAGWLQTKKLIPAWVDVSAPIRVSNAHLAWGQRKNTVFAADLTMENQTRLSLDLVKGPEQLTIKKLTIDDARSQAVLSAGIGKQVVTIDFEGELARETIQSLLKEMEDLTGWVQGDFSLHLPVTRPAEARLQGALEAGDFTYRTGLRSPVKVQSISIQAEGDRLRIDSAALNWRQTDIAVEGIVNLTPKGVNLDLVAVTEGFDWEKINRIVASETADKPGPPAETKQEPEQDNPWKDLTLEGQIAVKANYFKYGDLTWEPFHTTLILNGNRLSVRLTEGNLCGIQTEATAKVSPDPMRLEAEAKAEDQALGASLDCFLESKLMSGDFDLAGEVTTRGRTKRLLDNLQGRFTLTADDGRIFKFNLLSDILAVVNITEILKGQAPDLKGEGFGYKSFRASGEIEDGVLKLEETYIDGKSVDLAFNGTLDIPKKELDLVVLVTPLKTIDSIIERIPIVGHILGKNFMAVPVRVKGDLSDPVVTPLSPSAVGKGLIGVLERTLKLPVRVVQPFFPDKTEKNG